MAKAYVCDRCGCFFVPGFARVDGRPIENYRVDFRATYFNEASAYRERSYPNLSNAQLCRDCAQEFLEWFIEPQDDELCVKSKETKSDAGLWYITAREEPKDESN